LAIGNKAVTAITTGDLAGELDNHPDWKPTTVHSAVQSWKILFNFAVRRGYLVENPADRLELPKIIHDEPSILSVEDVKKLLAATLFSDRDPRLPGCRAYLAIGIFAGLRPDEIARLDWRHVDLATGTIRVKAGNAKDRDRRIVDLSPNLVAWLAPLAKKTGKVLACRIEVARAAARGVLGLEQWPQDIMRHTFASYHFGQHRNEAATKHQMGHRDDGRIFYNHYCVPVHRAETARFWSIFPPVALLANPEEAGFERAA
jgi:integrase